ncbi:EAL and HDOD domain-containing protein [Diaphorobacter caeni]|uniref:EAL and HDOD domain-containing protein n=1 Tax=Diaphorobacter caeni TaxID=2784387 RepID=UPI001E61FA9A|nr:EAL domain-containing protein [Diaphorobacter caeni]
MMLALTALSHAGVDELLGDTLIFVNCTHESLVEGHLSLLDPNKVILEVPPLGHTAAEEVKTRLPTLQTLHERGFRLAFSQTVLESAYAAWLPLADFIKLDLSVLPADQVTVLAKYAARQTKAQLIAEKVETAVQLELLSNLGVKLFQGYWLSRPQLVEAKLLFPTASSVARLLQLLRNQASHSEIEALVKHDAVLSFNLLRLAVTSGLSPRDGLQSMEHVISLLGHHRLTCWATLLQNFRVTTDEPLATARNAVEHGRFMELLAKAQQLPPSVSDQAFLVGVIAQLDNLLDIPSAAIVDLLQMPQSVRDAVLHQSGYLGGLLTLAQASEIGAVDELLQSASKLGLAQKQVIEARTASQDWAEDL